ncbi:peptidase S8/S53 domain-containing protein, partial [Pelagophyceae sp. CCMP2097]
GAGVSIFVIDTGCRTTHDEFTQKLTGSVKSYWSAYAPDGTTRLNGGTFNPPADNDGLSHGTHCAGIAAGASVGVARGADLYCIKVMSDTGSGVSSDALAGMDVVNSWYQAQFKATGVYPPTVVSLSLAASCKDTTAACQNGALANAVSALAKAGIVVTVAAGNVGADVLKAMGVTTPAVAGSNEGVISIGATDITDTMTSWSNYGTPVTMLAPGSQVWSSVPSTTSSYDFKSGTSMATPHVAGAAA